VKDALRAAVAIGIAVGVTWWMVRKDVEVALKPRNISPFQMEAVRRNKDRIMKQVKRLRRAKPIPW